jgi:hypothetical protein
LPITSFAQFTLAIGRTIQCGIVEHHQLVIHGKANIDFDSKPKLEGGDISGGGVLWGLLQKAAMPKNRWFSVHEYWLR